MEPELATALAVVGTVRRACVPPRPAANVVLDGKVGVVSNLEDAVHRPGECESRGPPLFQRVGPAERNAGGLAPPRTLPVQDGRSLRHLKAVD